MDILFNPNVAYLLLLAGTLLGLLALVTPGTGALEIGALVCLLPAGYAVTRLGFNLVPLILIFLSIIPFIYAIQKPKRELFLGLSILGLVLGSAYLFPNQEGNSLFSFLIPAVNPILALVASLLYMAFLWIAIRKTLQAFNAPPLHNLDTLVGQMGEAKTRIHEDGSVQVAGELWSARSKALIPAGKQVRVVARNGFILEVESESSRK